MCMRSLTGLPCSYSKGAKTVDSSELLYRQAIRLHRTGAIVEVAPKIVSLASP